MNSIISNDILKAAEFLNSNELVAIPTETVYGLAGNALLDEVVLKIFKLKGRPAFDPLIVHVGAIDKIHQYAKDIPDRAFDLMQQFWPGPLTLLLNKKNNIPDLVTSGLERVALRIPNHPLTLELLKMLDFPLAAPSANPFGYISPTTAGHVADQFTNKIPYILDGGPCAVGIESTIIGFEENNCIVYRLGGIRIAEVEKVVGRVTIQLNSSSNPTAPGMLKSHYAPSIPLYYGELNSLMKKNEHPKVAIICFQKQNRNFPSNFQIIELSAIGDMDEAARNLFSVMRNLDRQNFDCILAEPLPEIGLGIAVNDRLKRASVRY
jgi:L-threonylcarbamoyladenylate synthase